MHDNSIESRISDRRPVMVVAWGGDLFPGAALDRHEHVAAARRSGAILLPADADLIEHPPSGADGWVKREFGEGIAPSSHTPSRCCPVAIRVEPGRGFVHWALALAFDRDEAAEGTLRIGFDTTQRGTQAPATRAAGPAIDVSELWRAWRKHWTSTDVAGVLPIEMPLPGLVGVCVYGAARGVRIRKIAVSVCSREA